MRTLALWLLPLVTALLPLVTALPLWPLPAKISTNPQAEPLHIDICDIAFKITALPPDAIQHLIDFYIA